MNKNFLLFLTFGYFFTSGQDSTRMIRKEINIESDLGANVRGGLQQGFATGVLCNHLHDFEEIGDAHETVLEFSLQKSFGILCIQPDSQFVINPSGQVQMDNYLLLILRTSVTF